MARQHQDMDRAVVCGSSEGSGGPFTMEKDHPQCSPNLIPPRRVKEDNRTVEARLTQADS